MMDIDPVLDTLRRLPDGVTLRSGDVLTVRVLEVGENRRALVDLGRFRTLAEIAFPVAAGDELRVQVVESGGRLLLQLAPAAPEGTAPATDDRGAPVQTAAEETLRQAGAWFGGLSGALRRVPDGLALPLELRRMLDALRVFMEPLDFGSGTAALAARIKTLCEDSGFFLEHRLAVCHRRGGEGAGDPPVLPAADRILSTDLKARLLCFKDFFDSAAGRQLIRDSREIAGLARAAADALADIRGRQDQLPPAALFHPVHFALPLPGDCNRAALKVVYGRRQDATEHGYRAAVLLDLDRLGAVRADLTLIGAGLTVAVFVASTGLRDRLQRHASEIRAALAPFFDDIRIKVSVSSRKIARFAAEDICAGSETRVDVRI